MVVSSTQPALGGIRLAWWREALERVDAQPPPPEPRLQAVATELRPRGISGATLAGLEDGWAALLDEESDGERIAVRGERLFAIAGRLLNGTDRLLGVAGRLYAYQSLRRRGLATMHWPTEEMNQLAGHHFPRRLRPLTALARLAARDIKRGLAIEPEATPGRAAALLSHRLFGTIS